MADSSRQRRSSYSKAWLYRGNIRDIIVVLSCISALFYRIEYTQIALGVILLGCGTCLHLVTKGTLIRNIVLCRTGIYSTIRHPYYLANYLVDTAFCLLSGNILLLVLYPFLFFWAYGPTMANEERFLLGAHPDEFPRHAEAVPQIFPGPTSNRNMEEILNDYSLNRVSKKEIARILRFLSVAAWIVALRLLPTEYIWTNFSFTPTIFPTPALLLTGLGLLLYGTGFCILIPGRKAERSS